MKLTITRRLTLFYCVILSIFLTVVEGSLYFIHEYVDDANTKLSLSSSVMNSVEYIHYENEVISLDNAFPTYVGGTLIGIFNEEGRRIKGNIPVSFSSISFKEGTYQLKKVDKDYYLIYDHHLIFSHSQSLWIRGIAIRGSRTSLMAHYLRIASLILPVLLIAILWMGYFMTKRALMPIVDISKDVSSIRKVDDLSKRLRVGEVEDELSQLSYEINEMLGEIEASFIHEKQFYGDVSHELKTPVAIIQTECESLMEDGHEEVERIHEQAIKMGRIINQMLLLSRTHHKIEKEEIDLSLLFLSEVEQMREIADKKEIVINSDIEEGILYYGDEVMLMRMLMNLLDNAIKYQEEKGVINVRLYKDKEIVLIVEDQGIGMSDEEKQHFFDRFYRGKGRYLSEGSGMGMAIVKWIIEKHQGSIEVESSLGKGTKITVKL